ncbi:hypothetical protein PFISCL1PPCAC_18496 [Pristionchus fissidentatus]|uniref:Phytanoyl-CoA hydroxylase-interacting protein-like C-terminal domain-containing protein n=1 Tax=Pristionchus fissidentatus TaxID=1538716 RepID=A0AAV5W5G8_9BILA|nr:hypothetical protein PFISCL1PPCAC_18496 [Pristionchus fissidentatus]
MAPLLMQADLDQLGLEALSVRPDLYVKSHTLRSIVLKNIHALAGIDRHIIVLVHNAYHDGEDKRFYLKPPDAGDIEVYVPHHCYGCTYEFHVIGYEWTSGAIVEHLKFQVRSERSVDEQRILLNNIERLVCRESMAPAILYRNITEEQYELLSNSTGLILPSMRRKSGHPSNKAFNRFPMTYLCARLHKGQLPTCSPYGPVQLSFPAPYIINDRCRLFLVDMHCYASYRKRIHYLTLVIATKGSFAYEEMLRLEIPKLNIANNPFMSYNAETGQLLCATQLQLRAGQTEPDQVWVEVMLCDRALNIHKARKEEVEHTAGSTVGPRTNAECALCHATAQIH